MLSKKVIFFIFAFSLLIFFSEKILLGIVGNCARIYLHLAKGWVCNYESIHWENRQIVLNGFSIGQNGVFSCVSPTVIVSIPKKHAVVQRPHVTILEVPKFSSANSSIPWTLSIQEGTLEGMGLPKACFSFLKEDQKEGCLRIQWEEASLCIHTSSYDSGLHIGVDINQVPLSYFHEWIGKNWSGAIHGSFELSKEKEGFKTPKGQIEMNDISYEGICEKIHGKLDWEGPFSNAHFDAISLGLQEGSGLTFLENIWNEGRLRLFLSQGKIFSFDKLEMLFSFDGKSGAKWEISSNFEDCLITAVGRSLIQGIQGRWIETEVSSSKAGIVLKGFERDGSFLWELAARSLDAEFLKLTQKIADLGGVSTLDWTCSQGMLDGSIQIFQEEGKWNWKVSDLKVKDICLQKDSYFFSCKEACLKDETYVFSKGDFKIGDYWIGSDWSGEGNIASGLGIFSGRICDHLVGCVWHGNFDAFDANLKFEGDSKGEISLSGKRLEDSVHFSVNKSSGNFFSFLKLESLEMQGELRSDGIYCYGVKGVCDVGKKLRIFAPRIESKGIFDIRLETEMFELARWIGTSRSGCLSLDTSRSHFLNHPIFKAEVSFSPRGIEKGQAEFSVFRDFLELFLNESSPIFQNFHSPALNCSLVYDAEEGMKIQSRGKIQYGEEKVDLHLELLQRQGTVSLQPLQISDCTIFASLEMDKEGAWTLQGKGDVSDWFHTDLHGKFQSLDEWWIGLSQIQMNLKGLELFGCDIEGVLSGEGLIQWKGMWESDFDFSASPICFKGWKIENQEPLHLFFSSEKGISVRGVNAAISNLSNPSVQNKCKASLVQYDFDQSIFEFTQSQLYWNPDLWNQVPLLSKLRLPENWIPLEPARLDADISFSSDFSYVSISMKDGEIPVGENTYHIQNVHLEGRENEWKINLDLDHQMSWIPIDLNFHTEPYLQGRLTLENGMKIDWEYKEGFKILKAEGKSLGVDASFHLEGDSLIGSAKIDCHRLKKILPPEVAQVFYELKMGDGYELMGRIYLEKEGVTFKGILSGKQFELFGFRLRNLMAEIELAKDHVYISDVKISDFSGFMKIDQILAQGVGTAPWTLSIPHVRVTELRPSLLQEVGKPLGELTPLVVRELRIDDIQGVLEDSKTYTGKGELYFINSYKRGKSIFEVPSDILSRIVGLDLDLLVPVCGTLRYELRDGFFHFTELVGSYSENKRSEFFLVFNEDSPKMDLDWNLNIQIKMNQFVIFKITESFIISVQGKLDNPKFQLQRKKRFLDWNLS